MYISTCISPLGLLNDVKKTLDTLVEVGFDAYDYSMYDSKHYVSCIDDEDYLEKAKEIRAYADTLGIVCNQSHAPFPTWRTGETEYNEKTFSRLVRALEITGILGGKLCVVHPWNNATAEENAEFYKRLLPYAKANNVKIGVENMWNWEGKNATPAACWSVEDFNAHLAPLDSDWFVANLDLGHADMMRHLGVDAMQMVRGVNRLQGLHIHDNNCIHDNHAVPFTMDMNYPAIIEALREVGYEGDITLEVGKPYHMPVELIKPYMQFAAEIAKYIREQVRK